MTASGQASVSTRRRLKRSIFRSTLLRLVFGLTVLTLIGMTIAYLYVLASLESRTVAELGAYIRERGANEETIFKLAADNHALIKKDLLYRLDMAENGDPADRFEQLFVRDSDGFVRSRPDGYDGTRMAGGCILNARLPLTDAVRRRMLVFYDLVNQYGPAWHNRFQNTYISTPENIMLMYWPEVPNWCLESSPFRYRPVESFVDGGDGAEVVERETVWTAPFYDRVSASWRVSAETPVYWNDRQIATLGHDILAGELLERALQQRLEGTYNILLRDDGRLILHPRLIEQITRKEGYFDIPTMGDTQLKGVYEAAMSGTEKAFVVDHPSADEFLAIARLESVGWYFVTVFPKSILADLAFSGARMVLLLGVLALLLQGLVLYWVMRRQLDAPLSHLLGATRRLEAGDYQVSVDLPREDEFGVLGQAFNQMADRVRERDRALAQSARELEDRVRQRTAELEEAKDAALQAARQAERANRSKSAFLANMSHEIRTPMNAILGFTDILAGLVRDRQQRQYLKSIQTSGKSLLTLINDILDLSKVEAGKLELIYSAVDLKELCAEMEPLFSQKLAEKNLDFVLDIDPSLPPALLVDEVRLRQILINLIGNAVKFTEQGLIRLAVRCESPGGAQSTPDLVIEVEDSGIGIPAEQQTTIFGAFEQRSGQSPERYGGTGLGLAICKRLVELMNGEIRLDSEEGRGSRFTVLLHGIRVASVSELSARAGAVVDLDAISFAPATLLLVDDIAINRDLLRGYLSRYAFQFLEAENGREAVEMTRQRKPDLVLMDMRMPVMNGYEASERLKQDDSTRDIPVIALTASAMERDAREIGSLCDGYLRKPVSQQELVLELGRFLSHSVAEAQASATLLPEEATPWPPAELDTDQRQQLAQLLEEWHGLQARCDLLCETMPINDIEAFAGEMQSLGEQFRYPPLVDWGRRLREQTELFDLDGISSTLSRLSQERQALENLLKEEASPGVH
ncbi:ATP-binding protein [Marinobacterium aestuariivivens]|uniref:histidine kinase n=1 Tax=Marinobacterium aestuariivivens TaxID=1698799 RepID=A0ABW2A7I1_9GAMM